MTLQCLKMKFQGYIGTLKVFESERVICEDCQRHLEYILTGKLKRRKLLRYIKHKPFEINIAITQLKYLIRYHYLTDKKIIKAMKKWL